MTKRYSNDFKVKVSAIWLQKILSYGIWKIIYEHILKNEYFEQQRIIDLQKNKNKIWFYEI